MSSNQDLAVAYLSAYQSKNLDAIAAMIHPDVELTDWNISGRGAEFFVSETAKNFRNAQNIEIEVVQILSNNANVACELRIYLDARSIELAVVDVISFDEQGLITAIRAYKG